MEHLKYNLMKLMVLYMKHLKKKLMKLMIIHIIHLKNKINNNNLIIKMYNNLIIDIIDNI